MCHSALRARAYDRDLIRGEHYGQRPWNKAASKGRTHGSSDQHCDIVQKIPCQHGAVHTWHEAAVQRIEIYFGFTPSSGNMGAEFLLVIS